MSSPIVVRVPYVYRSHGFCTDFFYSTSKSSGSRCRVAANCGGYGTAYNTPLLCMNRCIELNAKSTAFYMVSVNGCGCSQTTSGMCTLYPNSPTTHKKYDAYEIIGASFFTSFSEVRSCSSCPAGTFTSVPNDETSCELCPRGKSSNAGSTSCDLTTIKLPNGNGKHLAAERVGDTLGRIVDEILGGGTKGELAIKKYGVIDNWDVSEVKDMSNLFYQMGTMNADLSSWDVSRVTTMHQST